MAITVKVVGDLRRFAENDTVEFETGAPANATWERRSTSWSAEIPGLRTSCSTSRAGCDTRLYSS